LLTCSASRREHLMGNVFFDTCVYHQPGIDLLVSVIDAAPLTDAQRHAICEGNTRRVYPLLDARLRRGWHP
jgi:4-oxalmesaconate hydratase